MSTRLWYDDKTCCAILTECLVVMKYVAFANVHDRVDHDNRYSFICLKVFS